MTHLPTLISAAALLALTGCNPAAPTNDSAPAAAEATTNYLAQINALPQGQQAGVFLRAIRDAGLDCQRVDKTQATETADGQPAWTATCTGGATYVLVLGRDGVMNVANARGTAQ